MDIMKFKFHLKNGVVFEHYAEDLTEEEFFRVVDTVKRSFLKNTDAVITINDCIIRVSDCSVVEWEVL